ncbi:uncharacterized protein TNCV_3442911 [Trichonephila clavipes]|nr:uncharacterized protein TNCV_3442911 [Trichonephila clavipes]
MLSAPDKALLVKLFYMNDESATIALRKFQVQKNVKSGKGPLTPAGLLKFVKRFEETGKLEDRARAGRPCLKEARVPCIAVEMEAISRKKSRREETVTLTTSGYNLRKRGGKKLESRPTMERNIQQGGPVRSRKGRGRNKNPYIEERTRSNNKNARRGGDQKSQDQ